MGRADMGKEHRCGAESTAVILHQTPGQVMRRDNQAGRAEHLGEPRGIGRGRATNLQAVAIGRRRLRSDAQKHGTSSARALVV